jgi:hypothetical protein
MPSDIKGIFSARLSNFNVYTKGHKVEVTNIETNTTTVYESIFFANILDGVIKKNYYISPLPRRKGYKYI